MNMFLAFALILGTVLARPQDLGNNDAIVEVLQNSLGPYKYTIHTRDAIRNEERLADGTVIGVYTIPDAILGTKTIRYSSGVDGFRILDETHSDLPLPVQDTPEVKAAREQFLAIHRAEATRNL